jgi:hypothetical protein
MLQIAPLQGSTLAINGGAGRKGNGAAPARCRATARNVRF